MAALSSKMLFGLALIAAATSAEQTFAQFADTAVPLPTFRVTQFNTAVSVPDGGTMRLGGVSRGQSLPGGRSTTAGNV